MKAIISDFSKVLLFRKADPRRGKLNDYHQELLQNGNYSFWDYFYLNQKLLDFYKQVGRKINLYIFTSGYVQEYPPLAKKIKPIFKEIFSAVRLGLNKSDPEAYKVLLKLINLQPKEVVFIDDSNKNIQAAKIAGLNTVLFTSTDDAVKRLKKLLNRSKDNL